MNFENKPPEWSATGSEPPSSLKTSGFSAGYKPPAGYFNWFWNKVSVCLTELQDKLSGTDSKIDTHTSDKSNPHGVTKTQVGLGSVDNTSDADKPVSTAQATAIADAKKAGTDAQSSISSHTSNTSNPHGVTKAQVGLGNVPNVSTNDQTPTYTAASTLETLTSGEKLSVSMGKIMKAITDLISHIGNKNNPHGVTAAQAGAAKSDLSNVDNTVLADKVKESGAGGTPIVVASSTDGVAYTATVDGLSELKVGSEITVIPNKTSTSVYVTLDVNGLGAKNVRQSVIYNTSVAVLPVTESWLVANKPVQLMYDGTQWKTVAPRTNANDMYGQVAIANGGTGANNAADARTNLEITPENIGAAKRVVWIGIAVNTSAWAASGSYYAATVSVSGMLSTDNPHSVDIERSDDLDADAICEEAFALVKRITTADGSITLYAMEIPASNFTIWMEGTR